MVRRDKERENARWQTHAKGNNHKISEVKTNRKKDRQETTDDEREKIKMLETRYKKEREGREKTAGKKETYTRREARGHETKATRSRRQTLKISEQKSKKPQAERSRIK